MSKNRNSYCLLLGSELNRQRSLIGAARSTELPIAVIHKNSKINQSFYADIVLEGDANEPEQVLNAVKRYAQETGLTPEYVIPLTEMTIKTGLLISEYYKLPYFSSDVVNTATDKSKMKAAFEEFNLPIPKYESFSDISGLNNALTNLSLPVVIKPRNAGGSEGVRMISTYSEVESCYNYLENCSINNNKLYGSDTSLYVVEEFIDAAYEVSVEVLNTGNGQYIIAMTDKYLGEQPYFVEMGHVVPSIWSENKNIREVAVDACKALNIDRGMAHVELKVTGNGEPILMEVNARPGGDLIMSLVEKVVKLNPLQLHCSSYINPKSQPVPEVVSEGQAAIAFLNAKEGVVVNVILPSTQDLPEAVVALNIYRKLGDTSKPCIDSHSRDGSIELYWPNNTKKHYLREHIDLAEKLTKQCLTIESH